MFVTMGEAQTHSQLQPHVTLVLGAGGPVGQAFHAGVMRALVDGCGWDARHADLIVGTSAGAQVGALIRRGWSADQLFERARAPGAARDPLATPPSASWPASAEYLRSVIAQPWRARIGPLIAALLPEGRHVNERLGEAFSRLVAGHWPQRALWIPAVHADSGARVVFGRADAPAIDVGTAVRCSSAVPGLRRPVRVGAARYIDGGISSPTHADLVGIAHTALALDHHVAVVVSPLSRFWPLRLLLRWELSPLIRRGIDVVLFEPDGEVTAAMGWNPMNARRAAKVADVAYQSTLARLGRPGAADAVRRLVGARARGR
jgi:NTE family protein